MWTLDDLAQHAAAGKQVVGFEGFVYDVTEFAAEHPGGPSVMRPFIGKGATAAFAGAVYKHSTAARNLARKYWVAKLKLAAKNGANGPHAGFLCLRKTHGHPAVGRPAGVAVYDDEPARQGDGAAVRWCGQSLRCGLVGARATTPCRLRGDAVLHLCSPCMMAKIACAAVRCAALADWLQSALMQWILDAL